MYSNVNKKLIDKTSFEFKLHIFILYQKLYAGRAKLWMCSRCKYQFLNDFELINDDVYLYDTHEWTNISNMLSCDEVLIREIIK